MWLVMSEHLASVTLSHPSMAVGDRLLSRAGLKAG